MSLDKPTFTEGEAVTGKVDVTCQEYVQAEGVRVEARAYEHYEEMEWVEENNQRVPRMVQKTNTLFSRDVPISGPSDFGQGPTRSFPFSVGIPSFKSSRQGGSIEYQVKGVVAVKGRPDITGTTMIAFTPATYAVIGAPAPQAYVPPPQYQTPGYPPQNYPQTAPAGYAPAPAPGYGQPSLPYPQYVLTQPQQPKPQVECSYCHSMMGQDMTFCPNCGGHR